MARRCLATHRSNAEQHRRLIFDLISRAIAHALRFTCPATRKGDKSSIALSLVLRALPHYGMFVADNGSAFYLSGAPDPRWSDDALQTLTVLRGSDVEVVRLGPVSS